MGREGGQQQAIQAEAAQSGHRLPFIGNNGLRANVAQEILFLEVKLLRMSNKNYQTIVVKNAIRMKKGAEAP
jgi:hypothetical protein